MRSEPATAQDFANVRGFAALRLVGIDQRDGVQWFLQFRGQQLADGADHGRGVDASA